MLTAYRKLSTPVDGNLDCAGFHEVLEYLSKAAGVKFDLDPALTEKPEINLACTGASVAQWLDLIGDMYELSWTVAENGVVRIGADGQYQLPEAFEVRARLDQAAAMPKGEEAYEADLRAGEARWRDWARDTRLKLDAGAVRLLDLPPLIQKQTGAYVGILSNRTSGPNDVNKAQVTLDGTERPAEELLADLARQAGLELFIAQHGVSLADAAMAAQMRKTSEQILARVRGILDREVDYDGAPIAGHRLAGFLKTLSGAEVVPAPQVWNLESPISAPAGRRKVGDLLPYLARAGGFEWRIVNGVLYLVPETGR